MNSKAKTWCDRPILRDSDADELDRIAALNEYHEGMPKHLAEDAAYRAYLKEEHIKGAAHHLARSKAARAAGDAPSAKKHASRYEMHIKNLGHPEVGSVPPEVQAAHTKQLEDGAVIEYQDHPADSLLLDGHKSLE